ncbi:MAG TPA: prolipoprotein diacylglyceryl transferase family protein [Anaerolineaceae bacterium]
MNAYSVMIAIGAGLGLLQVHAAAPAKQAGQWVNAALLALACALVGARLGFVALHAAYFAAFPVQIPQVWLGGLSWPGALAGGLLAVWLASRALEVSLGRAADILALLAPPLAVAAWLGSWQVGGSCGFLLPARVWWGIPCMDEAGVVGQHWPVQPAAALSLLASFAALELRQEKKSAPGRQASLIGLVFAANQVLFSILVSTSSPLWLGLRPDIWAAILLMVLCGIIFGIRKLTVT